MQSGISERARILITVKTYPLLSTRYTETVCTAGLREDGSWVRLYPVAYRHLDKAQRFRKYQWVEADILRDTRDPRPESHRLASIIIPLDVLDTCKAWQERKSIVLNHVYTNLDTLIKEARNTRIFTSLATFKPAKIISFQMEKNTLLPEAKKKRRRLQKTLTRKLSEHIPYQFFYVFVDENGKRSRMQILDWEIDQLCRKLIRKYGRKRDLIYSSLRKKYFDEFTSAHDLYFFLGSNKHWHIRRSANPFMIVGVFYPPKENKQKGLPG